MRKVLLTGTFALLTLVGFTQKVQPSSKVVQGHDQKALQVMNDNQLEYLNYFADYGFIVHNEAKTKEGLPLLSTVLKQGKSQMTAESINQTSFNPFDYNVTPQPSEAQFYLVDGSNKVVQIHSQSTIDQQYDRYLINQKKLNATKK